MKKFLNYNSIAIVLAVFSLLGFMMPTFAFAAGPVAPNLGTSGNFRILSETGVSDGNPTITSIVGSVGVSPAAGTYITDISCTNISGGGSIYDVDGTYPGGGACYLPGPGANKTTVDTAVGDMGTAYTAASAPATPAGVGANLNVGGGTLNGQNFVPGVYTWGTNVTITGDITITGSASDVWVFQVTGTLGINTNKKIILAGGALPSNIFWQVTGATTLQPGSYFAGNILDQTNIAMQAGATLSGRALAQTAVTLIGNTVSGSAPFTVTAPIATTTSATLIATSTATFNGAITSTGGSDATQSGFAYSTTSDLSSSVATSTLGAQTGTASFIQNVTGLSTSTTYYVRAYTTNSAGTGFGSIQTFTTSDVATYTLTYIAGANGTITGTSTQSVISGADGTAVTAVPNSGYTFVNWSDSSTQNPRTDTAISGDISVTANFTLIPPVAVTHGIAHFYGGGGGGGGGYTTPVVPTLPNTGIVPGLPNTGTQSTSTQGTFTRDLTQYVSGQDVQSLQAFLDSQGFTLANSGAGSPGNETTYFGPLTRAALAKFQTYYGITPASGYFGPITRAKVQQIISE